MYQQAKVNSRHLWLSCLRHFQREGGEAVTYWTGTLKVFGGDSEFIYSLEVVYCPAKSRVFMEVVVGTGMAFLPYKGKRL